MELKLSKKATDFASVYSGTKEEIGEDTFENWLDVCYKPRDYESIAKKLADTLLRKLSKKMLHAWFNSCNLPEDYKKLHIFNSRHGDSYRMLGFWEVIDKWRQSSKEAIKLCKTPLDYEFLYRNSPIIKKFTDGYNFEKQRELYEVCMFPEWLKACTEIQHLSALVRTIEQFRSLNRLFVWEKFTIRKTALSKWKLINERDVDSGKTPLDYKKFIGRAYRTHKESIFKKLFPKCKTMEERKELYLACPSFLRKKVKIMCHSNYGIKDVEKSKE